MGQHRTTRSGCSIRTTYDGLPPQPVGWCLDHRARVLIVGGEELCIGALAAQPMREREMPFFDDDRAAVEQLPRHLVAEVGDVQAVPYRRTRLRIDGMEVGDVVDDNAWADDGYRHHDLMHLANLAVMGWSPVMRAMLGKKRRSDSDLRRVEDGARSQDIEEAVVTRIFLDVMRRFPEFDTADLLSPGALDDIRFETRMLEVSSATDSDWQRVAVVGVYAMLVMRTASTVEFDVNMSAGTVLPKGIGPTQLPLPF